MMSENSYQLIKENSTINDVTTQSNKYLYPYISNKRNIALLWVSLETPNFPYLLINIYF